MFACGNVPMANERSSNTNAQPNVYLRIASSEDVTTTQLPQVFGSSSRSIVKYCGGFAQGVRFWSLLTEVSILQMLANTESCRSFWGTFSHYMRLLKQRETSGLCSHRRPKPKMQACGHLYKSRPLQRHNIRQDAWARRRVPASVSCL